MPPTVIHQAKEYSEDLHHKIPLDWTVHHTPSSYMDRDWWLKSMTQLLKICSASPVNNQILFFDGHNSHFDGCSLTQIQRKNIHTFILKAGDSINDQPNDNGPNSKLKALYNILKYKWMLNYGKTRFKPHHMNYVLVETWEAFTVSAANIIREIFSKTHLLPLSPPNMITNTQACLASVQTSSKGINQIAEDTLAPIKLLTTRTN